MDQFAGDDVERAGAWPALRWPIPRQVAAPQIDDDRSPRDFDGELGGEINATSNEKEGIRRGR